MAVTGISPASEKKVVPNYLFDIALSFAGEDRKYVEKVAKHLRDMGIKPYYDLFDTANSWGKDLYSYLDDIYRKKAKYTVIFISKFYANKIWTNHERKSAQARALNNSKEYVLPARFDDTEIEGLLPTIQYINLQNISPKKLAKIIRQKLGPIQKTEYLPNNLEGLMKELGISKKDVKLRHITESILDELFDNLCLMTTREKEIIWDALSYACPSGLPENIHFNMEPFLRKTKISAKDLRNLLSRINILHFKSKITKEKYKHESDEVSPDNIEKVEITYNPLIMVEYKDELLSAENGTYVLEGIYRLIKKNFCPEHAIETFLALDFSILNINAWSEARN